jgi:hypothetical protein
MDVVRLPLISKPTVFILGAGAHCPYGLPDGGSLYNQIIEILPPKTKPRQLGVLGTSLNDLYVILYGQRIPLPEARLVDFRNAMLGGGFPSIDSFMYEHRKVEGFQDIGRLVVPYILRPLEFKERFLRGTVIGKTGADGRKVDQDWMSYLFQLMRDGTDGIQDFLKQNQVAFITFNYDRTLEHFFYLRLKHTFHLEQAEAIAAMKRIEIKHVYGSFGDYDPDTVKDDALEAKSLQAAGSNIHLMYEQRGENPNVERAKQMLHTHYGRWVFLGFAFDAANIKVLGLDEAASNLHISATRYGIPDGEWARTRQSLKKAPLLIVGNDKQDSLAFLRETVWHAG